MPSRAFHFDPDADGLAVFLGPTEARLLELVWAHQPLSVKQARYFLGRQSSLAYTTVMTVLSRLAEKGILVRVKDGRHFVYRATLGRQEFLADRLSAIDACLRRNFPEQSKV